MDVKVISEDQLRTSIMPMDNMNQAIAKMAEALTDETRKTLMSDLTNAEVTLVSALYAINKEDSSETLEKFLDTFLVLKVSKNRLGRREVIELARANEANQPHPQGIIGRVMGAIAGK